MDRDLSNARDRGFPKDFFAPGFPSVLRFPSPANLIRSNLAESGSGSLQRRQALRAALRMGEASISCRRFSASQ
jgi:hypothetical protein